MALLLLMYLDWATRSGDREGIVIHTGDRIDRREAQETYGGLIEGEIEIPDDVTSWPTNQVLRRER